MVATLNSRMIDIEDASQYYTALHHKMDVFIRGDKDLKKAAIPSLPVDSLGELIDEWLDR